MRRKFSWEYFDTDFIRSIVYSNRTSKNLRPIREYDDKLLMLPIMDRICTKPDDHFVRHYRKEITEHFLAGSPHLVSIMKELEKRRYGSVRLDSMEHMLEQFNQLRLTSTVLTLIIHELRQVGYRMPETDTDLSIFTSPKKLDLKACIPSELPMYDYQEEAVERLHAFFLEENHRAGVLVMPTGSGKTRVATKFLLSYMVAGGWQIVWLTHRAMLIEQTASSFYSAAAALLPAAAPNQEHFKMICVSGKHASIRATEADDNVMIFGVQSLVRNLPFLRSVLGNKVMVVVDEAHHTLAPSYRSIIKEIQRQGGTVKLLGLTATPVRMQEADTARLMKLFDDQIIHSVPMSSLIARGYLSTPHCQRVDTKIDFDTTITLDEQRYIKKWGELSPETMERIARMAERNTLIADTYMQNREQYGKTLIFALNATHCISLCQELQNRGVRCDYIYCAHAGNPEKIARFQRGELDVLVNINVLTEGSDVPDIQTVFLTRPTTSDVLLMQMIGRGMRGESSGGTATVNIVDFHDMWGSFTHWLNPEFLFDSQEPDEEPEQEGISVSVSGEQELIPLAQIRELFDGVQTMVDPQRGVPMFSTLPVGWFDVLDDEGNDRKLLVFESQTEGYADLVQQAKWVMDNPAYSGEDALAEHFNDFGLVPTAHELQMLLDTCRISGEMPTLYPFTQRNEIDAALLAKRLLRENVGIADLDDRICAVYEEYSQIIDSLYGGKEEYLQRVMDFIRYPKGIQPLGMKVEELPEESLSLDRTPVYDLDELVNEVIHQQFDDTYGRLPPVRWTKHAYKSYFGEYCKPKDEKDGDYILINCVLNSKDVPREVVKYVIYHELLHRDNWKHDKTFRAKEHQFPNWTEYDRFLDFTFPQFNLNYAL